MAYEFSFSRMVSLANTHTTPEAPLPQPPSRFTSHLPSHPQPPLPVTSLPVEPRLKSPQNPPTSLQLSIEKALHHSLAPRTITNYDSVAEKFSRFCTSNGIPPSSHWPASEPMLCAFAASFAESHSGGTAAAAIAALKTHHHQRNMPWHGSQRLTYVLKGVARLAPPQSPNPKRSPVTTEMLLALCSELDLSCSHGAAILAIALVAFWSQCRLGELLGSSRTKHNPLRHPSRHDLSMGHGPDASNLWKLHLPSTKKAFGVGEPVLIAQQLEPYDPTDAITRLLQLTPNLPQSSHLFAYTCPKFGTPRNITREEFLKVCNGIWTKHGFPRFTGHSFRIGGTTELLASGAAPDVVKTTGRWTSDSYLKYWRGLDTIAANHIVCVSRTRRSPRFTH